VARLWPCNKRLLNFMAVSSFVDLIKCYIWLCWYMQLTNSKINHKFNFLEKGCSYKCFSVLAPIMVGN